MTPEHSANHLTVDASTSFYFFQWVILQQIYDEYCYYLYTASIKCVFDEQLHWVQQHRGVKWPCCSFLLECFLKSDRKQTHNVFIILYCVSEKYWFLVPGSELSRQTIPRPWMHFHLLAFQQLRQIFSWLRIVPTISFLHHSVFCLFYGSACIMPSWVAIHWSASHSGRTRYWGPELWPVEKWSCRVYNLLPHTWKDYTKPDG